MSNEKYTLELTREEFILLTMGFWKYTDSVEWDTKKASINATYRNRVEDFYVTALDLNHKFDAAQEHAPIGEISIISKTVVNGKEMLI